MATDKLLPVLRGEIDTSHGLEEPIVTSQAQLDDCFDLLPRPGIPHLSEHLESLLDLCQFQRETHEQGSLLLNRSLTAQVNASRAN